jgi:hypothetical protein
MKSLLPAALILTGFLPSVAFAQMQRAVSPAPSDAVAPLAHPIHENQDGTRHFQLDACL